MCSAGTPMTWVTPCFSIASKAFRARALVDRTTAAPFSRYPCSPGQASGRLWAIGRTMRRRESGVTSVSRAACFEL